MCKQACSMCLHTVMMMDFGGTCARGYSGWCPVPTRLFRYNWFYISSMYRPSTSDYECCTLYRQLPNPLNVLETSWGESFLGHEKCFSDNVSPASDRSPDKLSEDNRQKFDLLKTSQMSWNMCERTLWHTLSMILEHLETKKVSRIICPRPRISPRIAPG